MVWQKNGTPNTLSSASDDVEITDLTISKNNFTLFHKFGTVNSTGAHQVGNGSFDTASNYAWRKSSDGATDTTSVSQTNAGTTLAGTGNDQFAVSYIVNTLANEKLFISFGIDRNTAGSGNAPARRETVSKWANTTDQFDRIKMLNVDSGEFSTDTNLSALGDIVAASPAVGGWVELARGSLGAVSDTLTVSGLSSKRYYMLLAYPLESGQISTGWRLGNSTIDTGSNYAFRRGRNGSETSSTSQSFAGYVADSLATGDQFGVGYVANLSANEKLVTSRGAGNLAGAANAPNRYETAGKWVNTSNVADVAGLFNFGSGDFAADSELVVLGWDPDDTHTDNFWEELASVELTSAADEISSGTITAKKYLWVQCYVGNTGATNTNVNFNNDTGTNYARRRSSDGGSDSTLGSQTTIDVLGDESFPKFFYMFICNSASNEKLVVGDHNRQNTAGAASAPSRTRWVAKWANTTNQITEIDITNAGTGSYVGGSFLKVWGAD